MLWAGELMCGRRRGWCAGGAGGSSGDGGGS